MSNIIVTKRVFQMLVQHLADIEEEKQYVVENHFPGFNHERNDFEELINSYIMGLKNIINNGIKIDEKCPEACPLVLIGSNIYLKDLEDDTVEKLKLVSPFRGKTDLGLDTASYLSPMGRALLLKKPGEQVSVEVPMGLLNYHIQSVDLPQDSVQFY